MNPPDWNGHMATWFKRIHCTDNNCIQN